MPADAGLPPELIAAFEKEGLPRNFKRGTYLFHEAEKPAEIYLLKEGEIEISSVAPTGHRRLVTTLTPPRMFGELAVLGEMTRTGSALALSDVRVIGLKAESFFGVIERDPSIARALLRALTRHVEAHEGRIEDLLFLDLRGRVAKRLLDLAGASETTSAITQADLASLCGGSRENVTRILSELQRKGYIDRAGRRYRVLERRRLEKLADG